MIVSPSEYHYAIKWSAKHNRQIVKFATVSEPHIDIEFPLPDEYRTGAERLVERDEELLALVFNNIVQTAIRTARDQMFANQLAARTQAQNESETQRALAGVEEPPQEPEAS